MDSNEGILVKPFFKKNFDRDLTNQVWIELKPLIETKVMFYWIHIQIVALHKILYKAGWPSGLGRDTFKIYILGFLPRFAPCHHHIFAFLDFIFFWLISKAVQGSNPTLKCQFYSSLQQPCHLYQGVFRGVLNAPRRVWSGGKLRKYV